MSAEKKIKSYCIACKKETHQEILFSHKEKYEGKQGEPDEGFWAEQTWDTLKCLGCDAVSFRETSTTSEDFDYPTQTYDSGVRLFPQPDVDSLPIKPFRNVPKQIRDIYAETVKAFNFSVWVLCTAGIRAVLEAICISNSIVDGPELDASGHKTGKRRTDLKARIEGMEEKGLITAKHKTVLHEHRLSGNEAVHELKALSLEEAKLAIEIIEHTLEHVYEIPFKASDLRALKARRTKTGP